MNPWPPHKYRHDAAIAGIATETADHALQQARCVQAKGRPAILTLKHLAEMTETNYGYLRRAVERSLETPYRFFQVRKRSGGYRVICIPESPLFRAQKWLARHVLRDAEAHSSSRAYGPGQSIMQCAEQHCGCSWLIKIDIRQFFESISERQVSRVYRRLGYEGLISFEMARLCTRLAENAPVRYSRRRWTNSRKVIPSTIVTYDNRRIGHLPQGAPTSPMLSNLAMHRFDESLSNVARDFQLVYTRYSDDLIFSRMGEFTRSRAEELIQCVYAAMLPLGLRPHTTKTVIAPPGARKIVLGLLVDRERPHLQRRFRDRLEQHVYCLARNGVAVHAHRRGFRSIFSLQQHVFGLINFAKQVDPAFATKLLEHLKGVNWLYR